MLAALVLAPAALAATPGLRLTDAATVAVHGRNVRVGDIAAVEGGDPARRARIRSAIVVRLPVSARGGWATYRMPRATLARLIRRRVPGAVVAEVQGGEVTFLLDAAPAPRSAEAGCVGLIAPVSRGETIAKAATRAIACSGVPARAVAFDRSRRRVVATADMPADTDLGRLRLTDAAIERGASLRLVSSAGPVRIERAVTAMQASAGGRRLFVRDGDGQIFAARLAVSEAGR